MMQYNAEVQFLEPNLSNHSPMILRLFAEKKVKAPFQFLNAWCLHPQFKRLVAEVWNTEMSGSSMYQLTQKLKGLKAGFRELHKTCYSEIAERVKNKSELLQKAYGYTFDYKTMMNAGRRLCGLEVSYASCLDVKMSILNRWQKTLDCNLWIQICHISICH